MKYKLIPIMLSALLVAACDNKESTDNASPSLSEVTSSEAVKKAAESTMSKGDPSKPLG
jgi:nitrous oxide reductase accessory protein NosL